MSRTRWLQVGGIVLVFVAAAWIASRVLERVVHAPRSVLETGFRPALGTGLRGDEASIVELELGAGALDGARFLVAPMATFFHHGRSPGSGRR